MHSATTSVDTRGRAASCTAITVTSCGSASMASLTDSVLVSPPATTETRASRERSHSGGEAASSSVSATATATTRGSDRKGRSAWTNTGSPANSRKGLHTPPILRPQPAPGTATPTVGDRSRAVPPASLMVRSRNPSPEAPVPRGRTARPSRSAYTTSGRRAARRPWVRSSATK